MILNLEINLKEIVQSIISSGINAAKPSVLMRNKIKYTDGVLFINEDTFDLNKFDKVYLIGFGKVSALMAFEMEQILGQRIFEGLVITNNTDHPALDRIKIRIGSHPVLDEKVLAASEEIIDLCNKATEKDLVICLISGGGSSLFEKLPDKINLQDLQLLNSDLLYCGASIDEINQIRKCFSLVKNGSLLKYISPAKCISLIISDVVGDHIETIASGPTYYASSSFKNAYKILQLYNLLEKIPLSISEFLFEGLSNESEKSMHDDSKHCLANIIIGRNFESLKAAEEVAKKYKFNTIILSSRIQGQACEVANVFAALIEEISIQNIPVQKPACIIAGGETTVTVKGNGIGGRNQELALATLIFLEKSKSRFAFASCGTDGVDGTTHAAGGFVDYTMRELILNEKLSAYEYLKNNDSFNFLKKVNGLIHIPKGQTNVMDIMIGIIY